MKRTTLKLDETVLRRLEQQAFAEGRSLHDLANELLRRALVEPEHVPFTLSVRGWEATQRPGVKILARDALFDLMDGR